MQNSSESVLKRYGRAFFYGIPGLKSLYLRWVFGRKGVHQFEGWGMTTDAIPPWGPDGDSLVQEFLQVHAEMLEKVKNGTFRITQFEHMGKDTLQFLEELKWRHYNVYWTARYAGAAVGKSFVESGVCDGLTVFFALRALKNSHTAYLYDAWEGMVDKYLLGSEKKHLGDYAYLSLETTKKNLDGLNTVYVKGFIPDTFKLQKSPNDVVWLHIDLNASLPTADTLKEFFDRMPAGGVILFDDYGGQAYRDTKRAVDAFFIGKPGILLPLPTGQAIFFKR